MYIYFCYVLLILNVVSSYVAVIRSQWKNGARNEILWWLKGLWLQLVQRVVCNLNIYRFFTLKHFREQIPLNTLLEKLVTLPSHYLWVLNTSFKKTQKTKGNCTTLWFEKQSCCMVLKLPLPLFFFFFNIYNVYSVKRKAT